MSITIQFIEVITSTFIFTIMCKLLMKLTVGVVTCYKTDMIKLKRMLLSLLDETTNVDDLVVEDVCLKIINKFFVKEHNYDDLQHLTAIKLLKKINEPVELIVFIDRINTDQDDTVDAIEAYVHKIAELHIENLTVRLIKSEFNVSQSIARNTIIKLGTGDYIKFNDDDDLSININDLLKIIDEAPKGCKFIEGLGYKIETNAIIRRTTWAPWSCIIERQFAIDNNLVFIPWVRSEDSMWKGLTFEALVRNPDKNIAHMFQKAMYIHCDKSSNIKNLNPLSITTYKARPEIIADNTNAYEYISKVLMPYHITHNTLSLNTLIFRVIILIAAFGHGYSVLKEYLMNNKNIFEHKHFLELIEQLCNKNIRISFWELDEEHRLDCFRIFVSHLSLADVHKFATSLINFVPKKEIFTLYTTLLQANDSYYYFKKYVNETFKYNQLNEYTFNYICLLYIQNRLPEQYKQFLTQDTISLLNELKSEIIKILKNLPPNEKIIYTFFSFFKEKHKKQTEESTPARESMLYNDSLNYMNALEEYQKMLQGHENDSIYIGDPIAAFDEKHDIEKYIINPYITTTETIKYFNIMDMIIMFILCPKLKLPYTVPKLDYKEQHRVFEGNRVYTLYKLNNTKDYTVKILKETFPSIKGGSLFSSFDVMQFFCVFLLVLLIIVMVTLIVIKNNKSMHTYTYTHIISA